MSTAGRGPTARRPSLPEPALLVYAGLLVLAFAVLMYLNRDQWFFQEEWYAFVYARESGSWWDWLLTPYNGHLIALPNIEYRLLREQVGLHAYWPYVLVLVVAHLTVVVLLWRIAVRSGADPLIATATAMPFAVLGVGYEILLWAFMVTFAGGVAFGLGAIAVAAAPQPSRRRDAVAVALVLLAMLCSGIGVVMLVGLVVLGWLRGGLGRAARLGVVPALLFVAWSIRYPFDNPWRLTRWSEIPSVPEYVARGFSGAFGQALFGLPYVGGIAVVALAVYAVTRVRGFRGAAAPAYALACAGLAMMLSAGYTRIKLGVESGNVSRYGYVVIALTLPLASLVLTKAGRGRTLAHAAIVVAAIALTAHNLNELRSEADQQAAAEGTVRTAVLTAAEITAGVGDPAVQDASVEPTIGVFKVRDVRRMVRNGLVPELARPDPRQALALAPHVLVGIEPRRSGPDESCRTVRVGETVRVPTRNGRADIPFRSDGPRELVISIEDPVLREKSGNRELHWQGGPGRVVVLRERSVPVLAPTDGPVQVCMPARSTSAMPSR